MKLNNLPGYVLHTCIVVTEYDLDEAMSKFYNKNIHVSVGIYADPWTDPKIFIDGVEQTDCDSRKMIADCLGFEDDDLEFFGYYDDSYETIHILFEDPEQRKHNDNEIMNNMNSFCNDVKAFTENR